MCHVDLFPVPLSAGSPLSLQHPESSSLHGVPDYPVSDQSRPQYTFPPPSPPRTTGDKIFPGLSSKGTVRFGHESTYSNGVTSPAIYGTGLPSPVATYYNGIPILESSACTAFIVGTTVASSTVLKYEGTKQIIFTFSVCEPFAHCWPPTHVLLRAGHRCAGGRRLLPPIPGIQHDAPRPGRYADSHSRRVLRRAVQGLQYKGLPWPAGIDGPHQGACSPPRCPPVY